jgi:GntR family transcriptional regulator of vanillate catabolism
MSKRGEKRTGQQYSTLGAMAGATRGHRTEAASPAAVTLSQSVTDRLRTALLEGRFLPDEKLQEMSLSAMLNVSRTPIRAALHSLTAEGLLEYVPNRGYRVRGLDTDRLISVFDIRGMLEGLAARLAAERGMDEATQTEYRLALEKGDSLIEKGKLVRADRDRFAQVNVCIHEAILHAADNRLLNDMIRLCHNIPISSDSNVLWNDYAWLRRSHDDHYRMFEAILLRDGSRAEQLMREHVLTVKLHMKDQLERAARAAAKPS